MEDKAKSLLLGIYESVYGNKCCSCDYYESIITHRGQDEIKTMPYCLLHDRQTTWDGLCDDYKMS